MPKFLDTLTVPSSLGFIKITGTGTASFGFESNFSYANFCANITEEEYNWMKTSPIDYEWKKFFCISFHHVNVYASVSSSAPGPYYVPLLLGENLYFLVFGIQPEKTPILQNLIYVENSVLESSKEHSAFNSVAKIS